MVMEVTEPDNISIVVSEKRDHPPTLQSHRSEKISSRKKDSEPKQIIVSELSLHQIDSQSSDLDIQKSASSVESVSPERLKTLVIPQKLSEILQAKQKGITNVLPEKSPNFKNYKRIHSNSNAHSSYITSICWIERQLFATADKSGELKVWNNNDEVLTHEEDGEVTGLCYLGNFSLMYVFLTKLKTLNLKNGKVKIIHQSDKKITASTIVDSQKHLISLGLDNGVIKDFDSKTQQVIRKATLHKSRVNLLYSRGQYLISACADKVIVYDCVSQQPYREIKVKGAQLVCFGPDLNQGLLVSSFNQCVIIDLQTTQIKRNFNWNSQV